MNYSELGYSKLLIKGAYSSGYTEMNEDVVSQFIPLISGSNINGGISTSADGKIEIDWENGKQRWKDKLTTRIFIGEV